jgi:hypothetical protein
MDTGARCAHHTTPLYVQKLALKFSNQWQSLSWYSLLVVEFLCCAHVRFFWSIKWS